MRIFVGNVDSYVGKALCADLRKVVDLENKILGTICDESVEADTVLMEGMGVKRVVSRSDHRQFLKDVLSCSLIVLDLHSADIDEVEAIIKHLKIATLEHETTFVLISSVNVWANTPKERVPITADDEEEEAEEEEEEGAPPKIVPTKPKELSDADLDRRVPSPAFESWKYLEALALSLSSKEKLRPHVICAGILYGNGETTFNDLFKAAWLTQPTHAIAYPGSNYIPCVHVRDVARLVKVVAADSNVGHYLIAVDKATLTQREIVQGIVNSISDGREVPILPAEDVDWEFKDVMLLDLIMEPSAPLKARDFQWWCKKGIVEELGKVCGEFCKWRNLRSIKLLALGPPGAGTEQLCQEVAERYLHAAPPHFTFEQILQDAMQAGTRAAERLRARVEKLAPGAKLPLKIRTKLVRETLMKNVCRMRGYVLEGYPASFEEASALFMKKVPVEGEEEEEAPEADEEEDEEEEQEEEPAKPDEDEDEEEESERPKMQLDTDIAPEFVVMLNSSEEFCRARIFQGTAGGAASEEEFFRRTAEYRRENLPEDGSAGTGEFFTDVGGVKVLRLEADTSNESELFQAAKVYMESRGQFYNYLTSEHELALQEQAKLVEAQRLEDKQREEGRQELEAAEEAKRQQRGQEEANRRQAIADNEASLLEAEAVPLRQYLMHNVVPTLTNGLSEVCKEMPDDPIEYLAEYLFAHAQDIEAQLGNRRR